MGNCALTTLKQMTQRGNDVSNICRFVPKLTVNGQFMRDFMAEESPCFALGLVEERKQPCGFLALRRAGDIQFVFHFYGFGAFHTVPNPKNRLDKTWSLRKVDTGAY